MLSSELPHGFVRDLHYNAAKDVVVVALLGRGAWTLTGFFQSNLAQIARQGDPIARYGVRSQLSWAAVEGFHLDLPVAPPVAAPVPFAE